MIAWLLVRMNDCIYKTERLSIKFYVNRFKYCILLFYQYGFLEQDKSSNFKEQPPFGDRQ